MEQDRIIDAENDNTRIKKRPIALTVICVIGFIGAAFAIYILFTHAARSVGSWYQPYLGFSIVVGLAALIGLWKMKKWGAYLYAGLMVVNQIVMAYMGVWNITSLIVPAIVTAIAFFHIKDME